MKLLLLPCPYCSKVNRAKFTKGRFFKTDCTSCSCDFQVEVIAPDFIETTKIIGLPENEPVLI